MEPNTNEATAPKRLKSGGRKPLIIIGIVLAVLAVLAGAAYLACCYLGTYSDTFAPRYTINGVNVGGLTVEQASEKIWEEYQQRTVSVYLSTEEDPIDFAFGLNTASDLEKQGLEPVLEIPVSELGVTLSEDYAGGVRGSFIISHGRGFFVNGWNYLRCLLLGGSRVSTGIEGNRMQFWERADAAAAELSRETIDAAYELGEDSLTITVPRTAGGWTARPCARRWSWRAASSMRIIGPWWWRPRRSPPRPSPPGEIYDRVLRHSAERQL